MKKSKVDPGLTAAELIDDLGEPTQTRSCIVPKCNRTVGPYYSSAQADDALVDHKLMQHSNTPTPAS